MKYLSLFSGVGGFELGIQQAYENVQRTKGVQQGRVDRNGNMSNHRKSLLGAEPLCIGFSEKDKYATQIYQKHFPNHKAYGDVTKIDEKTLPDFDLLVGGFPCQSFSIAGKRKGFEDTRGTMFFEIARIVREKQPRLLLLENVKGLLSHDKGNTFYRIISTLDELGYDCQWQVLNSKNHGVPQNRERVFIIGHLRGTPRPEVFPFGEDDEVLNEQDEPNKGRAQTQLSTTVRVGMGTKADSTFVTDASYPSRVRKYENIAPTVRDYGSGGNKMPFVNNIRKLTPTECERLQGFPDGWTEKGVTEKVNGVIVNDELYTKNEVVTISDTQRYKTLGNAVTVNVIRDIMVKLL